MHALVHAADVQDRDGGALVMATLFGAFPFLLKLTPTAAIRGQSFAKPSIKSSRTSTSRS
jgi:hypothetical protein